MVEGQEADAHTPAGTDGGLRRRGGGRRLPGGHRARHSGNELDRGRRRVRGPTPVDRRRAGPVVDRGPDLQRGGAGGQPSGADDPASADAEPDRECGGQRLAPRRRRRGRAELRHDVAVGLHQEELRGVHPHHQRLRRRRQTPRGGRREHDLAAQRSPVVPPARRDRHPGRADRPPGADRGRVAPPGRRGAGPDARPPGRSRGRTRRTAPAHRPRAPAAEPVTDDHDAAPASVASTDLRDPSPTSDSRRPCCGPVCTSPVWT